MRLREYVSRDQVFILRDAEDKRSFLGRLVELVWARLPLIDKEQLLQRLLKREEQVTTGIGHGVAIPHAMVEGLEHPRCVIVQTPDGLDFEALDASPVHVTFLLLSPPGGTGVHIRLLARIARLADNEAFVARVATASSEEEVFALTLEEDGRHV